MKEENREKKYLKPGVRVECSDGKAGKINKIIADPRTQQPNYLVVKMGLLRSVEVVVPVSLVSEVNLDAVRLDISRQELSEFPQYEVTQRVGEFDRYQPIGRPRPVEVYRSPARSGQLVLKQRSVPEHTVGVRRGMAVLDVNGVSMGEVEGLVLDVESEKGSHVVFRNDGTHQLQLIPVALVESAEEGGVRLRIDKETAHGLPTYLDALAESLN